MELSGTDKLALLQKAADIALHAATGSASGPNLATIIEQTYNKMIELAEKA